MLQMFRIDYSVISTGEGYKANILSYSRDEAEMLIQKLVGADISVRNIEIVVPQVTGIADDVIKKILVKYKSDMMELLEGTKEDLEKEIAKLVKKKEKLEVETTPKKRGRPMKKSPKKKK